MNHEIARAGLDDRRAVAPVVHRAEAAAGLHQDAVDRDRGRNAVVDGVDDAADGLRPVAQRRRPPHHLDLPGGQRIDGDGMIVAERRHIACREPVLLDAHAKSAQAADDRPARSRRKRRRGDAGPCRQRIAERGKGLTEQLARRCHRDRHEGLVWRDRQRRAAKVWSGRRLHHRRLCRGGRGLGGWGRRRNRTGRDHENARQLRLRLGHRRPRPRPIRWPSPAIESTCAPRPCPLPDPVNVMV